MTNSPKKTLPVPLPNIIEVKPLTRGLRPLRTAVPGSKSYTNRALLLAALAKGTSIIKAPLSSEDTQVMVRALRLLGVRITRKGNDLRIEGKGGIFTKPRSPLHLGNAGTAVRSLAAAVATQPFKTTITGDKRMRQRPIEDLAGALRELGAKVQTASGCPPLTIKGPFARGSASVIGTVSSQYLSALLMAAPLAKHPIKISVQGRLTSLPYVEMTLETMEQFGITVKISKNRIFSVSPGQYIKTTYQVEGDASSATYPLALAALHATTVTITNVPGTSRQADISFLEILKKMGCRIHKTKNAISATGPKKLKPLGNINLNQLPDAAMTVAILCAFAKGRSKLTGLANLRVKETDRLSALTTELSKIGAKVRQGPGWLEIIGDPDELHGGIIETYSDHRMAMCFAIVGSRIPNIKILNPGCVAKTYPEFWRDLKKWGIATARVKHKSNIVLCGLRGSGKTTIGKALAKKLKYRFIDTDHIVEQKNRSKIAAIVEAKGWDYFRKQEAAIAKELANNTKAVIATGGGMFIHPKNISHLKKNGFVVLLHGASSLLAERVSKDSNRPRLTRHKTLKQEMAALWKERRENYYSAADMAYAIDPNTTPAQKAKEIGSTYAKHS